MSEPIMITELLVSQGPLTVRRRVRWGDCDPAQVVYTPRFADYAVAALDYFHRIVTKRGVAETDDDFDFPMRALSFDFHHFLMAEDVFDMAVHVGELRTRTFNIHVIAADGAGRPLFSALCTPICFQRSSRRPIPLPSAVRTRLLTYSQAYPLQMAGNIAREQ